MWMDEGGKGREERKVSWERRGFGREERELMRREERR